jgi:insertion element IS1 protein InsB
LETTTREIVGVYIGDRDEVAARELWSSLPPVYRQCAVVYTDFWAAYGMVIPSKRHRAVGKAKQRGLGGFPQDRVVSRRNGENKLYRAI